MFSKETDEYLKQLIDTPSPSGFESDAQRQTKAFMSRFIEKVYVDNFGNVVAHLPNPGKKKLMVSAHIDEVGFMVKHIDDDGFLYIVPIGGVDTMLLPGLQMAVHNNSNSFLGVVGRKPIHLLNEAERAKFSFEDLWLDCGFTSRKHALMSVRVGSPATFITEPRLVSEDILVTRSADNKIGSAILMHMASVAANMSLEYDLYLVSTRQEEIGLRGGITAALSIKPDLALVIDATHATDYPGVNKSLHGKIDLGKGPSICISPDNDEHLRAVLTHIAESDSIPLQIEAHPNASGTESRAIQLQLGGIATANLSYPVRYMHSPNEMVSLTDIRHLSSLLQKFIIYRDN